ncbi:MAG: hypothetical protein K2G40_04875 [Muribaculaceae bacterium]|nr:hypothetical protein [Muribaculaceae bacterium]
MKKTLYFLATIAVAFLATACGGSKTQQAADEEVSEALTVDEVLANADKYNDQTITIEGICSHLCAHGGRKAFIQGNADNKQLRCEAFPGMDAPFAGETVHKPLKVTGILRAQIVNEEYLQELERTEQERAYAINAEGGNATAGESASGCDTERAAHGQANLTTLNERIADYRARIAAQVAKGGKDYLAFPYMEATSYEILPE